MKALRLSLSLTSGMAPALALDFLSGSLDARVTFTRGSNATLTDSTGKVTYAPANLVTYSQEFDNAAWTKSTASVTANDTQAPNGTTTADKVIATSIGSARGVYAGVTTAAAAYTISVYAKSSGLNWLCIYDPAGSATGAAWFNLATGAIGTVASGYSAAIINVGNGWYRCAITKTLTASTNYAFFGGVDGDNSATVTSTTSGVYIWGAQLEPVTYQTTPGTYVATTSSAYYGPRFDYDPVTLAAKGLLIEEARTNLLTYSEQFDDASWSKVNASITANTTMAPNGVTVAETITATTGNGYMSRSATVTSSTLSLYVKQGVGSRFSLSTSGSSAADSAVFNLATGAVVSTGANNVAASITSVGNGWYRLVVTRGATAGNATIYMGFLDSSATAGDYHYVWGAQLEAGAFATSYIPTVASTVTRSADVATMTGTNFSSWYNQSEGTLIVSGSQPIIFASSRTATALSYSGTGSRVGVYRQSAGPINGFVTPGAGAIASGVNATANNAWKGVIAYDTTTAYASVNGSAVVTGAHTASLALFDNLGIGGYASGVENFTGHIRQIAYFNTRLPNAQLQSLTA